MDFILNLPSSLAAAGFPFHWRRSVSRWRGSCGFAGNARPGSSARRSSIAGSCPPLSRTQGSKRTASVEPKVSQSMFRGSQTASRRFIWSKHRTKFLTNYLMQQASDGKGKDALFKEDTLREVAGAVSQQFQRQCCAADVQRRLTALREKWRRVERIKSHGSASWDYATRTICIREEDYQQYALDHSKYSGLLNRPIQDYDELSFIFGDEYDPSAAEIRLERDQNTHSDDSKIPEDSMEQKIANEDIRYLVLKIGELIDAVKSLKPRDFADDLWKAVTACSYNERMSIAAFEYFLKNEIEGKIFLVRSPDLRKEWLAKFFSSLL
ncbi:uncharacterized protein LOC8062457 isoform X3 [Sorghum bicolor]|uniref:uncharacterized protein LOC8062457 isoform X3 n=1 Tax=Sorghum bicolor TaxID=4558 RepID=UPI000B424577|nr:uncharacterized protein LOC8062457 isoform X3 [Sorghum bicolor]|eukprot:XP_021313491.1 uncharacterized protein LOC8062457 isoform X3 [Sorghum bicolor]